MKECEIYLKDAFVQIQKELYRCVSLSEFIKKDTFPQALKELHQCVSLSNSSRKTHLYKPRKSCTNVYLCPNSSRKTHLYSHRKSCTNVYLCPNSSRNTLLYRSRKRSTNVYLSPNSSRKTLLYRRRKSCTNVYFCQILQEGHIRTGAGRAVQLCISVEFIKKDTFVQAQKELYKCVSLSNSSRKTHLYKRRKSCTIVYLCPKHQERHICTDAERPVQMCISVEYMKKDTFVQPQKELYKYVSMSEFIKKDTFVQAQKKLNKCVSLSNSSRKTHLYRCRKSGTNVYLSRIHQER